MLVVVKKPPTEFVMQGNIPKKYITMLKKEYGNEMSIEDDDEMVSVMEMDWYKEQKAKETPGDTLRFYRKLHGMTQSNLAEKLEITKQKVSNMEHNLKPISRKTAYQLSEIFGAAPGRFI